MKNPYVPFPVTIADIVVENSLADIKTFTLAFDREEDRNAFSYLPGQFAGLSLPGVGEAPIGIASSPTEEGYLLFTVKRMGAVTSELHASLPGGKMGIRGPFGHPFPWDRLEGGNVLVVGGGFAFTTLRSAVVSMLHPSRRPRFGTITAVYGAREPGELLYKAALRDWAADSGIDLTVTIDRAAEGWTGTVGLVPSVLKDRAPKAEGCIALVCGPPIMIKFTLPVLLELGFPKEDVFVSLENRMKCGIGKCGRCNIGSSYVCLDGPVFSCAELDALPGEY
jgi:sulfhydrogenase subunit gamma (sulfur reductase)